MFQVFGRLPQERRAIRTSRQIVSGRGGVAVIRGDAETSHRTGQEGEMLLISELKTDQVGAAGVAWLGH